MAGEIALYRISTARFVLRLAEQAIIWILGLGLVLYHTPTAEVVGVILFAIVYARNLEFVHECLHGTALVGARANRLAGTMLALPMLVSFERWRYEHARHHRDVRIEGFRYDYERLTNLRELAIHVLMLRHFADALGHMVSAIRRPSPLLPSRLAQRSRREYLVIAVLLIAMCAIALTFRTWLPVLAWLAPLPLAAIVHTHIELPEHLGLARAESDALQNSRIIRTNRFLAWFVNGNNYHAVHHWNARIPMAHLAAAQRAFEISAPTERYSEFFARLYRGLADGAPVYFR